MIISEIMPSTATAVAAAAGWLSIAHSIAHSLDN
jgi:hypothetical protein